MARRGWCRCGLLLKFRLGAKGYKTRCPRCGAVVRLHVGARAPQNPAEDPEIDVELVPWEPGPPPPPAASLGGLFWLCVGAGAAFGVACLAVLAWWFWL